MFNLSLFPLYYFVLHVHVESRGTANTLCYWGNIVKYTVFSVTNVQIITVTDMLQ